MYLKRLLSIAQNCKNEQKEEKETVGSYSSNQYAVLYAFRILKKLRENEGRPSWGVGVWVGGVGGLEVKLGEEDRFKKLRVV